MATPALGDGLMVPRESKRLRIGVVGGGFGAAFPWHEHPDCDVTAVSDLRADRRHNMREHFRCNNVYEEFHPMLRDPKLDAVAIRTGAPDHTRHAVDALHAGKHLISAVPAAMTLDECVQLVNTVKRTGLTPSSESGFSSAPRKSIRSSTSRHRCRLDLPRDLRSYQPSAISQISPPIELIALVY